MDAREPGESVIGYYGWRRMVEDLLVAVGTFFVVGSLLTMCDSCAVPGTPVATVQDGVFEEQEVQVPPPEGETFHPGTTWAINEIAGLLSTGEESGVMHEVWIVVADLSAEGSFGTTNWTGDRFVITLDDNLSFDVALDTLVHEWAHVMSWEDDVDDHGPHWGVAYAAAYRRARGGQ